MILHHFMVKEINLRMFVTWLFLGCFLAVLTLAPAAPALAQTAAGPEAAAASPAAPEEKKETAPSTAGPMMTDTTIPIDTGHVSVSVLSALSFYPGFFNSNWRTKSIGGNFYTYYML